jgi:putative ABC transport system permease protein
MLPLRYSVRSLWVRRSRSALTALVIALVVVALGLLSGLISSMKASMQGAGSPENLIVLRKGATSDGASSLPLEVFQALRFFDGVARGEGGEPLVSPELLAQPFAMTRWGSRESAQVRGVEPPAFAIHDEVRVLRGRALRPSSGEAMVGRAAAARYAHTGLGDSLPLGNSSWTVVGIFEAGGSALESEIWIDARQLASDVKRPSPYSSLRLRVAAGADAPALIRRIEADPRFALAVSVESEYYAKQAASADTLYLVVAGLALLAGAGAAFGATNTLYAAVQARTREIGTLRALGFSRAAVAGSFLLESALIALVGFALGSALAWLATLAIAAVVGEVSTFGANGTLVSLRLGARDLAAALALALAIGLAGALAPALRAARLRPIDALRKG